MRFLRFNNFRLDTNGYEVLELDISQMPELRVDKYSLASTDGIVITNKNLGEKQIKLKGRIIAVNENDMNDKLTTLKYQLSSINKSLDFEVSGETRRTTATVTSTKFTVSGYSCFYEIVFSCNSFSSLIDSTSLSLTTPVTVNPNYHTVNILGGYSTPLNIDLTLNNYDGLAQNDSITVENINNGDKMRITRDWIWADKISIDGENKRVLLYPANQVLFENFESTSDITIVTASTTGSIYTGFSLEGDGMLALAHTGASTSLEFYSDGGNMSGISIDLQSYDYLIFAIAGSTALANITNIQVRLGSAGTTTNYRFRNITTQYDGSAIAGNSIAYIRVDLSGLSTAGTGASMFAINQIRFIFTGSGSFNGKTLYIDQISATKIGTTPQEIDYEGGFINLDIGNNQLKISDNFAKRNISLSANYKKRYI